MSQFRGRDGKTMQDILRSHDEYFGNAAMKIKMDEWMDGYT